MRDLDKGRSSTYLCNNTSPRLACAACRYSPPDRLAECNDHLHLLQSKNCVSSSRKEKKIRHVCVNLINEW